MDEFKAAKAAAAKLDQLILARAKELYPHFIKMWSETAIGYEGGAFCQEDALEEARKSLEAGQTAEEWAAARNANKRVMRTFYISPSDDEKIRTLAARTGRSQNDIMVDMIREGLAEKGRAT